MRHRGLALYGAVLGAALPAFALTDSQKAACGPRALFLRAVLDGKSPTYEEVVAACSTNERGETTLRGLREGARALGYRSPTWRQMTEEQIVATRPSAVLYDERTQHFVAVVAVRNGKIVARDPAACDRPDRNVVLGADFFRAGETLALVLDEPRPNPVLYLGLAGAGLALALGVLAQRIASGWAPGSDAAAPPGERLASPQA